MRGGGPGNAEGAPEADLIDEKEKEDAIGHHATQTVIQLFGEVGPEDDTTIVEHFIRLFFSCYSFIVVSLFRP